MDILDILIAKKQSFTAETEKLVSRAKKAMADANAAIARVTGIEQDVTDARTAAEISAGQAAAAAAEFAEMKSDITSAAAALVDEAVANLELDTNITIEDHNTSAVRTKTLVTNNNDYTIVKNYTSTGQNVDGSMTQKAITEALRNAGGGNGNISGSITAADNGSLVTVDENGGIEASTIKENDIILTQIITGTYKNDEIIGLEIDYANKTFSRLQGAIGLNAGNDFNKFNMYNGRKRCIVNANGSIVRFLGENENIEGLADQRIMVYQPAFYYLRVPLSITETSKGKQINKEQIYISDKKFAGFTLHPIFRDINNNPLDFILLSAFEGSAYIPSTSTYEKNDAQNIDFSTAQLVSIVNAKPISGQSQNFTLAAAKQMASNCGTGWAVTDLALESMNQMLMSVEYGSLNLQNAFNPGLTQMSSVATYNIGSLTGSTVPLGNASGRASSTINTRNGASTTQTTSGACSISYRGVENPYGNMWKMVDGLTIENYIATYKDEILNFTVAENSNWISAFGYDKNHDWIFLPIETSDSANNNYPVGDKYYIGTTENTVYGAIIGGYSVSGANAGIFYYGLDNTIDFSSRHDTARVMFIPTYNSTIYNNNYNAWSSATLE